MMGLGKIGDTKISFVNCNRYVLYLYANEHEYIDTVRVVERPNEGLFVTKFFDDFDKLDKIISEGVSHGVLELWIGTACDINHTRDMSKLEGVLRSGLSSIKGTKNWYCLEKWKLDLKLKEKSDSEDSSGHIATCTWECRNIVYESLAIGETSL